MRCPNCSETVIVDGGWTPWCAGCDWNVDPNPPQPSPWRVVRWQQARLDAATRETHRKLMERPESAPGDGPERTRSYAMALTIQLMTAVIAAIAVAVWFTAQPLVVKIVVSALLGVVVVGVLPIRRHRRADRSARGWQRHEAPAVFALLDSLAAPIGSRAPDRVNVDASVNASIGRIGGETILKIGLPLWAVLDAESRAALLGHELGHFVNGDIRNRHLIVWSSVTTAKWLELLWPGTSHHQQRIRRRRGLYDKSLLADQIIQVALLPIYSCGLAIATAYRTAVSRSGQRAEYRADRMGLVVGGTSGMTKLMDITLCADIVSFELSTAARRGDAGLLDSLPRSVAAVPDGERERLRRRAAGRFQRIDSAHPPTVLRAEYVAAAPYQAPTAVNTGLIEAADAELRRATEGIERDLRAHWPH